MVREARGSRAGMRWFILPAPAASLSADAPVRDARRNAIAVVRSVEDVRNDEQGCVYYALGRTGQLNALRTNKQTLSG